QKRKSNIPMAIVIHAGAGYHSLQNESFHLAMCSKAASEGMKLLKAGRTAVEAVEAAIKVLENNEITNAGYGSNLSIDGTVECDATMVDHFGRSGACGAVPNVKNPISLAKLILETSSQSLTLRRVPPNFLVGEGAKLFAVEHGMSTVTNEQLTSRNAKDRYTRWRADLDKIRGVNSVGTQVNVVEGPSPPQAVQAQEHGQDQMMTTAPKAHQGSLRDHTSAIMTATWNEGQPDSPSSEFNIESPTPTTIYSTTPNKNGTTWAPKAGLNHGVASLDGSPEGGPVADLSSTSNYSSHDSCSLKRRAITEMTAEPNDADLDLITDTMGAIAIDKWGNIAAGSSSGGIGMKHRGRTGPAALVGIGTVVIPYNEHDPDFKTVAAVTSGTGEHMATTMAAAKCAERLYQGTMKGPTGRDVEEDDTAVIMQSFVENDFMGHPGVRNQTSARAIGVMAVEVNEKGVYLHWAHNTDSFALASFNLKDKVPHTCMSRLPEGSSVNVGARKLSNGDQIFD
ncbi:N-terminal nucleophile aminohydrolase, partial [Cryphonectria parasitica EP155]